jgi:hypothetical protein
VKKEVWEITKKAVSELRNKAKWSSKYLPQSKEVRELEFIYRIKKETFYQYLKWYDLKTAGLSFRTIAAVNLWNSKPERRDAIFHNLITEKGKVKIGVKIKGESNVRKGFIDIYKAIHRKQPPSKENHPQIESRRPVEGYNCPEHGNQCSPTCRYLKQWMKKFNMRHRETPLIGIPHDVDKFPK